MKAPLYLVNLSASPAPRSADAGSRRPDPLFRPVEALVKGAQSTQDFGQLRTSALLRTAGPLILYIVAHAVPDGLIDADGNTLKEKDVANLIREGRRDWPTVVVWDACFAGSFLDIEGCDEWGPNYVHIFACQDFERTWQRDRFTQFSQALKAALDLFSEKRDWNWDRLETELQDQLGTLQTPDVVAGKDAGSPADFF